MAFLHVNLCKSSHQFREAYVNVREPAELNSPPIGGELEGGSYKKGLAHVRQPFRSYDLKSFVYFTKIF